MGIMRGKAAIRKVRGVLTPSSPRAWAHPQVPHTDMLHAADEANLDPAERELFAYLTGNETSARFTFENPELSAEFRDLLIRRVAQEAQGEREHRGETEQEALEGKYSRIEDHFLIGGERVHGASYAGLLDLLHKRSSVFSTRARWPFNPFPSGPYSADSMTQGYEVTEEDRERVWAEFERLQRAAQYPDTKEEVDQLLAEVEQYANDYGLGGKRHEEAFDYRVWDFHNRHRKELPQEFPISFMQAVHDAAMTRHLYENVDALKADGRRVTGVMGGHAVRRDQPEFLEMALTVRRLVREQGAVIVTGGGPGLMEAANIGAYFANYEEEDLLRAIEILKTEPKFDKPHYDRYVTAAKVVREQYPPRLHAADAPEGESWVDLANFSVPTWKYGHEPPNLFTDEISKYHSNAQRENVLLKICDNLVIGKGAAGTTQEIFQRATRTYYEETPEGDAGPDPAHFYFLGEHWEDTSRAEVVREAEQIVQNAAEGQMTEAVEEILSNASEAQKMELAPQLLQHMLSLTSRGHDFSGNVHQCRDGASLIEKFAATQPQREQTKASHLQAVGARAEKRRRHTQRPWYEVSAESVKNVVETIGKVFPGEGKRARDARRSLDAAIPHLNKKHDKELARQRKNPLR